MVASGPARPRRRPVPAVSVVIPTYNHRDFILRTLGSVFAQTFTDYEVIVVNDGSPDDTAGLLRPLAEAGRIRYLEQPNQGQGAARNRGILAARGEFIALLDDDDLWPEDKLEWQVAALRARPGAVLVYGLHDRLQPDGSVLPAAPKAHPAGSVYREFLKGCWLLSPGQALVRASALRRIGGFDPRIWGSDDWDLYIRLARQGDFCFENRVALHYRVHATNASHSNAVRHARNHFRVIRKHAGWNLPLIRTQLHLGALYFVPHLYRAADGHRERGNYVRAAAAFLHAAVFQPSLLLAAPRRLASLAKRFTRSSNEAGGDRVE
jgi:glycosyltransferase involved in cell wall biosynthesis